MTTDTKDVSSTLHQAVVERLKKKTHSELMALWRDTGISYYWLRKVANGEIDNPGVKRTQYLYEYLTNRKLRVDLDVTA